MRQLSKRLLAQIGHTSHRYRLLEPGDRVMVAVSGGKDSMSLLHLLHELRAKAPFPFSLIAVNLDQGQPGFPVETLPRYFEERGFEHRIVKEDTYSIVKEKVPEGRTTCSLCSRLRRGVLYNVAEELGCTKIALGHHREDTTETLLLNLLYSGQIKAMPPRLRSDDGRNVVIRPLIECAEADIAELARLMAFPIIPCNLCGSQANLKRQRVKDLIAELTAENPNVPGNLLASLSNVRPSHLMDPHLSGAEPASPGGSDALGWEARPMAPAAAAPSGSQLIAITALARRG
ncbi:MAG: tRNA 2-thiocytidine(32) synthetase TtcA [Polyangiaceae bacterium]|nr:tRNA 2-thiocytidine(32) synthetase TtcA [Polyangiaceae bacterium]MCW5790204.1 tRNA 2-thiocytidine(32) synthetase TtcA [Polyangiaceae bacterium]